MYKMRHEEQVFSVSWKPAGLWSTVPTLKKFVEPFLVSSIASIKPPSIIVWDRRGKEVTKLLPWELDSIARKLVQTYIPCIWLTHPVTKEVGLVSCDFEGHVIIWTEEMVGTPQKLHVLTSNFVVFGFVQCGDILWTLTQEPVIMGWNFVTGKTECVIPTYEGICSIQTSPLEQSHVALGGMDCAVRIIKMGADYPQDAEEAVPIISIPIKGKITAVRFH